VLTGTISLGPSKCGNSCWESAGGAGNRFQRYRYNSLVDNNLDNQRRPISNRLEGGRCKDWAYCWCQTG